MAQQYRVFFGPNHPQKLPAPSEVWKKLRVDSGNSSSPFSKFIGNEMAVRKLRAAAFDALGRPDHLCRELAFALFGPASSGKTTLARIFAQTLELPFVELSPKALKSLQDLHLEIARVCLRSGVPLVEVLRAGNYCLPPSVVFIDEVHALSDYLVQGLLKATEHGDAVLVTEKGLTVDCFNVCWIIATTDEGRLFDAFRSRFSAVNLVYLTRAEVSRIVSLSHPDLPKEVCELIAFYNSRVPRKALEFARYMKLSRRMSGKDWREVAREVAEGEGIDSFGMQEVHLRVLRALKQGPISRNRMVNVVGRKSEEVERYIMPWLLTEDSDQKAMVRMGSRGYCLTEAGEKELEKRNGN